MRTTRHGNRPTPLHLQVVPERRNPVNSRAIALRARNLRLNCVEFRARSGAADAGGSRKNRQRRSTCLTNAHSVRKSSRPSMIGSAMRSHFIYPLSGGYVRYMALGSPRTSSSTVSFVANCRQTTLT